MYVSGVKVESVTPGRADGGILDLRKTAPFTPVTRRKAEMRAK
jgi:hypothetical protein